jgi:hypothetical protein
VKDVPAVVAIEIAIAGAADEDAALAEVMVVAIPAAVAADAEEGKMRVAS